MRNGHYILDAHCHIYPEKLAARAGAHISAFYGGLPVCGGSVSSLLPLMQQQGIDFALINSAAMTPHQVDSVNRFILETAQQHAQKFAPIGTMHPDSTPQQQAQDLLFLKDHGFHAIKLHPDMLQIPVDAPGMLRIFAQCQEADLPVLLHTGDARYDFSNPNRMQRLLPQFPRLTFIGGHFGGRDWFVEAADQLHGFPNFFVDCSSSFDVLTPAQAMHCIRTYGADRVMFGTDHPIFRPGTDLRYLESLPLSEAEQAAILWKNACRIYRVTPPWCSTPAQPDV